MKIGVQKWLAPACLQYFAEVLTRRGKMSEFHKVLID